MPHESERLRGEAALSRLQAEWGRTYHTDLLAGEKSFLDETIRYIEDPPTEHVHEKARFELSKRLWRNRNHFLSAYLETVYDRALDADGRPLRDSERARMIELAQSYIR